MSIGGLVRTAISATMRAVDVALALPRIALALERIADATDDVRRLADITPAIEAVTPAIEAMGAMASEARRLLGDPARYEELMAAIAAIIRLGEAAATIGPLGEAVRQLNTAAAALSTTVTPLQGASEWLGRLVDRPPASKPRRPSDIEPDLT